MTPQLLDTVNNSDYAHMTEMNENFDKVNIEGDDKLDMYQEFRSKFNGLYKRYKSKKREVCKRIELETAHLVSEPMVKKLRQDYSQMMCN